MSNIQKHYEQNTARKTEKTIHKFRMANWFKKKTNKNNEKKSLELLVQQTNGK